MNYKANKIQVADKSPYIEDRLDRKEHIKNLSLLLRNISSPITLSINAPWGEGKTTFLEMLNAELKNDDQIIKFSAWETDFAEDPLLVFLGEMNTALKSLISDDEEKSDLLEKAMKVGGHILKRTIPIGAKLVTGGLLDIDATLEGEAEKLTEKFANDLIDKYSEEKNHIDEFRKNIEEIISEAIGVNNKIFILIDELDRCRPTYAIELLERIKHLFDIDGLVFVLAMDREQLSHSVKAIYGNEFDSFGYLKRFIDIEYDLPKPSLEKFIFQLLKDFNLDNEFEKRAKFISDHQYESKHFQEIFNIFAMQLNFSLRDIEQFIAKIKLIILTTSKNESLNICLLVFLTILRERYPNIYSEYIKKDSPPNNAIKTLKEIVPNNIRRKSHVCAILEGKLIQAKIGDLSEHEHETLIDSYQDKATTIDDVCWQDRINAILHFAGGANTYFDLNQLIAKIELTDSFTLN
ncbi:MAG: KAP family P-loop NTPase fold protein [Arenicella sp.]